MKSKTMCAGCYNDDYNHGLGGAKGCWLYEDAKIVKRIPIRVDQPPPYEKKKAISIMSCYRKQKWAHVNPDILTHDGFWKS